MFFNQSTVLKAVFSNSREIESNQHSSNKFLDFEGIDEALELNNPSDTWSRRDKKGNPPGNDFYTSVRRKLPKLQLTCYSEKNSESTVESRAKCNDNKNDRSNHPYLGDSSPPNITSGFRDTQVIDNCKKMDAAATKKDLIQMRKDSSVLHGDIIDNITEVYRKQGCDIKAMEEQIALIQAALLYIETKCDQLAIQQNERSQNSIVPDFNEPGSADSVNDSLDSSKAGSVLAVPKDLDSFYLITNNCVEDHFKAA